MGGFFAYPPAGPLGKSGFFGTVPSTSVTVGWVARHSGVTANLNGVAFNGTNLFVAVGGGEANNSVILRSPDGIVWTPDTNPFATNDEIIGVVYAPELGLWVATAEGNTSKVATSADGIAWTLRTFPQQTGSGAGPEHIAWNGSTFCIVSSTPALGGGTNGNVWTSPDGINWTARSTFANNGIFSIIFDGAQFVAGCSSNVGQPSVATSADGITWSISRAFDFFGLATLAGLAYGAITPTPLYVLFDTSAPPDLDAADTANPWNGTLQDPVTTNQLFGATFGSGLYVAVGGPDTAITSPDATTWTVEEPQFGAQNGQAVCFGLNKFVAVGTHGVISTRG